MNEILEPSLECVHDYPAGTNLAAEQRVRPYWLTMFSHVEYVGSILRARRSSMLGLAPRGSERRPARVVASTMRGRRA